MKMLSRTAGLLLVATLCLGLAQLSTAVGGEKKEEGTKKKLEQASKEGPVLAVTVDFSKELGLNFPSLTTIGARIEQARQQSDPVVIALLGRELAVAEKVSGKQAAVKSETLLKEAAKIARQRYDADELKAVAMLIGKGGKELNGIAEKAAEDAKEKKRGIQGRLHADSRVNTYIDVYVDGRYVGTIPPFGDIYPWIGQTPWETTYLSARSRDGRTWNHAVGRAVRDFHWILNP